MAISFLPYQQQSWEMQSLTSQVLVNSEKEMVSPEDAHRRIWVGITTKC